MLKKLLLGSASAVMMLVTVPTTASAAAGTIRFCTGPDGGNYSFSGIQVAAQAKNLLNVVLVPTRGSMENLDKLADGSCDAAIVQSDADMVYRKQHPSSILSLERGRSLYPEFANLICNKETNLSKITGLKKGMTVLVGPNGGGSSVTWDAFRLADPGRYGPVSTQPIGGKRGLGIIEEGREATCLFYVAGLGASFMNEADTFNERSGKLALVATNDSDVGALKDAKGRPVYEMSAIPSGTYPRSFQTRSLAGSAVSAIAVPAIVVANTNFIDQYESTYDKFLTAVDRALPTILEHVQGGRR